MATARTLINSAYKKISVLGQGSTLTASEANDGLTEMNAMIAQWSTDGALIYTETKETFDLTGAVSYTIGSGQTFDTTAPKAIKSAYVTENGYDTPVDVIDFSEYSMIADKDLVSTPNKIYFDSNYPTANIYVWPVGYSYTDLTIFSEKPLSSFTDLDTVFALPPEYETALVYNLAVRLAPEHEKEASPTVKRVASDSLKAIRKQNKKNNKNKVAVDGSLISGGSYDVYSGRHV